MASFGYTKHKLKNLEFAQQHFSILKVHFESKLILIQWLDEEDWTRSTYTNYIIYNFLVATRPHVYDSWNITQKKKKELKK